MSQTYTPGTILCSGFGETLEQVVVLSDGKVATKTYAGKPVTRRDIMSLEDWKILVGSFTEDYIPVGTSAATDMARPANTYAAPESGRGYLADLQASAAAGSSSAILELNALITTPAATSAATSAATPAPAPEVYPIGTFLRWRHPDGADRCYAPNARTAIVIKNGILQVKEMINGKTTMTNTPGTQWQTVAKKFFSTVADWKASLPEGGAITTKAGEDYTTPSIKRKAAKPIEAADDISYIGKIQQRYSVHARLTQDLSPMEQRDNMISTVANLVADVNRLLASPVLKNPRQATNQDVGIALDNMHQMSRSIKNYTAHLSTLQYCIKFKPDEAHLGRFHFKNEYKQRLVAFLGGKEVDICSSMGFIGLAWDKTHNCANKWARPTLGNTFAELGLDMKADGKPRLKVYYRKDSIEL
jgi:hypothetical protein